MEQLPSKHYGMTYQELKAKEADQIVVDDEKLLLYMDNTYPVDG